MKYETKQMLTGGLVLTAVSVLAFWAGWGMRAIPVDVPAKMTSAKPAQSDTQRLAELRAAANILEQAIKDKDVASKWYKGADVIAAGNGVSPWLLGPDVEFALECCYDEGKYKLDKQNKPCDGPVEVSPGVNILETCEQVSRARVVEGVDGFITVYTGGDPETDADYYYKASDLHMAQGQLMASRPQGKYWMPSYEPEPRLHELFKYCIERGLYRPETAESEGGD